MSWFITCVCHSSILFKVFISIVKKQPKFNCVLAILSRWGIDGSETINDWKKRERVLLILSFLDHLLLRLELIESVIHLLDLYHRMISSFKNLSNLFCSRDRTYPWSIHIHSDRYGYRLTTICCVCRDTFVTSEAATDNVFIAAHRCVYIAFHTLPYILNRCIPYVLSVFIFSNLRRIHR